MHKSAKQVLATNLQALMSRYPDLDSQTKIAARTNKPGGKKVAQTSISNMLNPNSMVTPTLENIEAIAVAFGLQAWQLLHPTLGDNSVATEIINRISSASRKDQNLIYQILEIDPPANPDKNIKIGLTIKR